MPDDKLESAVAEQAEDTSFGEGFEGAAERDKGAAAKTDGAGDDGKPGAAEGGGKVDEGDGADKGSKEESAATDAGKPADDATAAGRLEARAKAAEAAPASGTDDAGAGGGKPDAGKDSGTDGGGSDGKGAEKPKPDAGGGKPAAMPDLSDLLAQPEIAGIKIGAGDGQTTIGEFAKEYPEAVAAPVAIAKVLIEKALAGIGQAPTDEIAALRSTVATMQFWEGVHEAHADGRKVVNTPEFKAWVGKQSPLVKKLVTSWDPADGVAVLDAYKESLAKGAKAKSDADAAKRKTARDGLHSETLRGTGGQPKGDAKDKDDFDAGFEG